MNKVLFLLFYFISISNLSAQNKISLVLRDGKVLNGFGRIKTDGKIVFKKSKDGKKTFYNYRTVKQVIIIRDSIKKIYEYKIVHGSTIGNNIQLLPEPIIIGKIYLYSKNSSGVYTTNIGGGFNDHGSYSITTYFISKKGNNSVNYLSTAANIYSRKFKKFAFKFFADCPDLIDKINSYYFKRDGIEEIVKYYNENCDN